MINADIAALIGLLRDRRFKGQEAVRDAAADALEACRNAALEEAARIVKEACLYYPREGEEIAAAIRALAGDKP
jgi:hypothetical protein